MLIKEHYFTCNILKVASVVKISDSNTRGKFIIRNSNQLVFSLKVDTTRGLNYITFPFSTRAIVKCEFKYKQICTY